MSRDGYLKLIRLATAIAAIVVWALSIQFSASGFNFEVGTGYEWAALGLGLVITVFELAGNHAEIKHEQNITLFVIWMSCYAYGVYTNFIGIMNARSDGGASWVFALVLGFFLEVSPEVFFVWALTGDNSLGDFFNNILGATYSNNNNNQQKQNRQQNIPQDVMMRRDEFHQKRKGGGNQNFSGVPFQPSGEDDIERFLRNIDQRENGN